MSKDCYGDGNVYRGYRSKDSASRTIILPQRKWVGLTDDEIKDIIGSWGDTPIKGYTRKLFDQIEAKLKEKNA